jgi:hypothetical protein
MRWTTQCFVAAVVVSASLARAQAPDGQPGNAPAPKLSAEEIAGNNALAERFAQMAQMTLASQTIVPATLRQSAALLEEACHLSPNEPRFPRLLAECYVQLSNQLDKQGMPIDEARDGAIAALDRYLKIPEARGDQHAQVQFIDLQYSKMDSGDAKRKYLQQLLEADKLAAEVRAHAAVRMAELARERGEPGAAKHYIDEALKLFPLSPQALRMQYALLDPNTPPAERAALLLQLLRSNPSQPGAMTDLAGILADVGLVDPALQWYQQSFVLAQRIGQPPNLNVMTAFAAQLVIADQLTVAQTFLQQLLGQDPTNSDASFLALLIAKRGGDADKVQAATEATRTALQGRLSRISDILNRREAATQPSGQFDVAADLKLLAERGNPNATALYGSALADLAWLEIYYNGKPADAQPHIESLRQILPADAIILARLEGWAFLADGKKDEARVKLSAVADHDPFARLGMIRLDDADADQAAQKLLADNASGVVGAMLIESLRDKVGLMPQSPSAPAVRSELDKFPKEWLDVLEFRTVSKFYSLKAEPLNVAINFGEPILTRVSISNTGTHDITVGPNGTLHSDLWIDCQVKGIVPQYFAGVAFDRLGGKLVLKPRETITQTVRVDQDGLAQALQTRPNVSFPLYFNLLTNPVTLSGGISPGPAGQRQQFTKVVERKPSPVEPRTIQDAFQKLTNGSADVKVRTLELLATFAKVMAAQDDANLKAKAAEITDVIRKATSDRVAAVKAQATFMTALLSDETVREGILKQMLAHEHPLMRMSGLSAVQGVIDPQRRKEWVKPLADSDPDEIVRKFAASVLEVADLPPPTTQPAPDEAAPTAGTGN